MRATDVTDADRHPRTLRQEAPAGTNRPWLAHPGRRRPVRCGGVDRVGKVWPTERVDRDSVYISLP